MIISTDLALQLTAVGGASVVVAGGIAALKSLAGLGSGIPESGQTGYGNIIGVLPDLRYYKTESPASGFIFYHGVLVRGASHINVCLNIFADRITIMGTNRLMNLIPLKDVMKAEVVYYEGMCHYMNTPQATGTVNGNAPGVQITFRTKKGGWKRALFLPQATVLERTRNKADEIGRLISKLAENTKSSTT